MFSELIKNLYRLQQGEYDFKNCFDIMNFIIFMCIPIIFIMTADVTILLTTLYGLTSHWEKAYCFQMPELNIILFLYTLSGLILKLYFLYKGNKNLQKILIIIQSSYFILIYMVHVLCSLLTILLYILHNCSILDSYSLALATANILGMFQLHFLKFFFKMLRRKQKNKWKLKYNIYIQLQKQVHQMFQRIPN